MKKHPSHNGPNRDLSGASTGRGSGVSATVNEILKTAYRRHVRGKVARAAMEACLGR
jgi:hypothetical protein